MLSMVRPPPLLISADQARRMDTTCMSKNLTGWRTGVRNLAASAAATVNDGVNEDCIRLAVTGLSRAGKTVFVTSIIHNLLALGGGKNTLPRLATRLGGEGANRLVDVTVLPAGAAELPRFDYPGNLAGLAAQVPVWPQRTDDLAQISLSLTIKRKSALGQRLGSRRVRLDILDYPGEWLLDLPLLGQTFAEWSAETFRLLRCSPRREASASFLGFIEGVRSLDRADEAVARQGHDLYLDALETCRRSHGVRYLQPGRFLCPGPRGNVPFMWFFPLEISQAGRQRSGTLAALLTERFEAYKRHIRADFFDTWFSSFNRQVMLVDLLGALFAGQTAFEDTARAIQEIATAFRYGAHQGVMHNVAACMLRGANHLLPAALTRSNGSAGQNRRVERVVFVATKADHVPALKRDNLRHLLKSLCAQAGARQDELGAEVRYQAAASLMSTEDGTSKLDGRPVQVVRGLVLGEDKVRSFYVGDVPVTMPTADFWADSFFELPQFRPPIIDPTGQSGMPHLGLDLILEDLIGDLL
jgi:predicted YcjX-like family ATPase